MSRWVRLGRFSGVPVVADQSAFMLALLFGGAVFIRIGQSAAGVSSEVAAAVAVVCAAAIVGSLFLHEVGHVLLAERRGLTIRSIRLYMFGGYTVIDGVPSARTELLVAIAGPVVSALLGVAFLSGPILLGTDNIVGIAMWALAVGNIAIAAFNLLPGFPLDGGRILRSILSDGGRDRVKATRAVASIGRTIGFVVALIGVVLVATRNMSGLFWIVGGGFLATAAVSAGRREQLSVAFDGMTVADAMHPTPEAVSGNSTIVSVLDAFEIGPRLPPIPVQMSGRVVGIIGHEEIDSIAPSRWPSMRVRALMTRIGPMDVVDADVPLESIILAPSGSGSAVVVVRDGVVVGIVDRRSLSAG